MTVYDQWHKSHPRDGDEPCEHRTRSGPLYPTAIHGKGRRYQVRWRDDKGEQQKRSFTKKLGVDPETCADAFDADVHSRLNSGTYVDPAAGKITLSAYAKQWRAGLTSDPTTLAGIDSKLRVHIHGKPIGDLPMKALSRRPSLVQQWIAGMTADGMEPSSIKVISGLLSSIFFAAIDDEVVAKNPLKAQSVRPPNPVKRHVVPWTLPELEAGMAAMSERYRAMVYMCAGCGHRQGEAFAVAEDDLDEVKQVIRVRRQVRIVGGKLCFYLPKRGKERTVPYPPTVAGQLREHMELFPPAEVTLPWRTPGGKPHTAKLLFVTPGGGALNKDVFNVKEWRPARAAAGVPQTRANGMHVTRHTFASACLAAGVDILTLAAYLGHEDAGFTLKTYTHLMPSAADRARAAMEAFFTTNISKGSALYVPAEWTKSE